MASTTGHGALEYCYKSKENAVDTSRMDQHEHVGMNEVPRDGGQGIRIHDLYCTLERCVNYHLLRGGAITNMRA